MSPDTAIYYDPYDYEIDADPHPVWQRMRESQPLYRNERYGFWALSRFEDVWAAYHDTMTFSSSHGVQLETLDEPVGQPSMIFMDPPEHDRLRKLVNRAFTPRRVRDLEAYVASVVGSEGSSCRAGLVTRSCRRSAFTTSRSSSDPS